MREDVLSVRFFATFAYFAQVAGLALRQTRLQKTDSDGKYSDGRP